MKAYNNPHCMDTNEFSEDIKRIKYVKRLFRKYSETKVLRTRLILNHLMILYNVFGAQAVKEMLFLKVEPSMYSTLKTFLVFLNYMKDSEYVDVPLDQNIVKELREV